MRHRKRKGKLGRRTSQRKALLSALIRGLLLKESIVTTLARAKEAKRLADKFVSLGKEGTVSARREAYEMLQDRDIVQRLFKDIAPLFAEKKGGYARVIRIKRRRGDGAEMAILEFTEKIKSDVEEAPKKEKPKEETPPAAEKKKTAGLSPHIKKKPEHKHLPKGKEKNFFHGLRKIFKTLKNK